MENGNNMGLEEFVEETIIEVMNGAKNAAKKVGLQSEDGTLIAGVNVRWAGSSVDFDVAVTVSQDAKGGGGLKIAVLGLQAGGEMATATQSVHRIKFSVPVTFAPRFLE